MNLFKFEWPETGGVTATSLITSNAIILPFNQDPKINQIINESRSGARQTAELGDTRQTLSVVFPALDQNDYEDLWNFLSSGSTDNWTANYSGASNPQTGGIKEMLRPFKFTDENAGTTWTVFLNEAPKRQALKGRRWRIGLEMIEMI